MDDGKLIVVVRDHETVFTAEHEGRWSKPQVAPFSYGSDMPDCTAGPDGKTLYFMSSRPIDPDDHSETHHLWTAEWTGTSWAKPSPLARPKKIPGNGSGYPTATADGTVYFISDARDGFREGGIYRTRNTGGKPQPAELVERPINGAYVDFDPCVAPDESYLLFNSNRPGGFGSWDTYLSLRKRDGTWTPSINLGPGFNSSASECCPTLSSDGRFLFFASSRETPDPKGKINQTQSRDRDTYWVETGFIEEMRSRYLDTESPTGEIISEYRERGIRAATEKLTELHSVHKRAYSFLPNDLLRVCEEMIDTGHAEDADSFYEALVRTLPETGQIMLGYALLSALSGSTDHAEKIVPEIGGIDPSFDGEDVGLYLGHMLSDASRYADAKVIFELNTKEHPDSYRSFYYLATVSKELGDFERARKSCLRAQELAPENEAVSDLWAELVDQQER